jgi:integral membrane protein (TIGR01906 family)
VKINLKLKIFDLVIKWVFILCIPLLLLSLSLAWGFNSKWMYNFGFNKYNVSLQTGFNPIELDKAADGLIKYFNSNDEYVEIYLIRGDKSVELFTREEKIHFKDVKQLIRLDYTILLCTLLFFLFIFLTGFFWKHGKYRKELLKNTIWGCGISILIILITGVVSYFDFDQLFLQFHYLAFSNQYWSASGYMLMLFPGGFWIDAALFCGIFMTVLAILLSIASFWYLKIGKSKNII